ncbi:hypothetical protein DPMN_132379 [Dreissena polymorpha]|uniref:Uncharacterized protein n=1 Tax=Dreissena polymorpha TaxID=45954 RepID=A0A9D4FSB7_DREPO|nr:hypothetical protein DPMN_132379 [Dreissena polymorpha]
MWMLRGTWEKIEKRRKPKQKINRCCDQQQKTDLRARYWEVNQKVKKSARQDKRQSVYNLAETASKQTNMTRVYEITRALPVKSFNKSKPVKTRTQ